MSREQYEAVCKAKFEEIGDKLDVIHDRLFVDNGSPCMQSRLNRTERLLGIFVWVVIAVSAASIAQITRGVINRIHLQHTAAAAE